jgi:transcription initiation factor TFIIA small subunit
VCFLDDPQGNLNTYRFCDNVWTFVLNKVEFRDGNDLVNVDKVKIVACDGKGWPYFVNVYIQ